MREKLQAYFRHDNRKTWSPIIAALAGFFFPTILNQIFDASKSLYWILFAVSVFSIFLFLWLTYRYVDKSHSILMMLRSENENLYKSCAFMAVMERSKYINRVVTVNKISVHYQFACEPYSQDGRKALPYHLKYIVEGFSVKSFSNFYYHLVCHKSSPIVETIKVKCNNQDCQVSQIKQYGSVCVVKFSLKSEIKENERVQYIIEMDFPKAAGLTEKEKQRFLFYPRNHSDLFSDKATAKIFLNFPMKVGEDFINKYIFCLHKYFQGSSTDIANEDVSPEIYRDYKEGILRIKWENKSIGSGLENPLFAIELLKKQ